MTNHTAWIITIGNEVVDGRIVNTNASWLGRKLTMLGFNVLRVIAIPDVEEEIVDVIKEALKKKIRVIITTGGLGPTYDDKTSECLAKALNVKWVLNSEAFEMVKAKYSQKGLSMTYHREKMAMLPEGSKPIPNPIGTAPGIFIKYNDTLIFALPGVPSEMKSMFEKYVEPLLKEIAPKMVVAEKIVRVINIPESTLAPILEKVLSRYSKLYIKSHPKGEELEKPIIDIYIKITSTNRREAEETLLNVLKILKEELEKLGGKIHEIS